ncbi:hypothetical protein [Neptunomonas marina]|uniref:hypothetical protein n=1 Tax=Neptunomonas marina TaxID=1815562 RepID=UPI0013E351DE|nr:hypothetical protein [Neptunomonas marina]
MNDDQVSDLILRIKQRRHRHDRKQLFDWETRHLSSEQKQQVEQQVRDRWGR